MVPDFALMPPETNSTLMYAGPRVGVDVGRRGGVGCVGQPN